MHAFFARILAILKIQLFQGKNVIVHFVWIWKCYNKDLFTTLKLSLYSWKKEDFKICQLNQHSRKHYPVHKKGIKYSENEVQSNKYLTNSF